MGRSSVANHLRMLDLPETIQSMLRDGKLSLGHGKALAGVRGTDARYTQIALAEKASAETASVRELERWIHEGKLKHRPKGGQRMAPSALTADEAQMLDILRTKLHSTKAKVALKRRGTHGGQLTLSYASLEELEAVLSKLGVS
jgi:ParB family chromosome partitioning protein